MDGIGGADAGAGVGGIGRVGGIADAGAGIDAAEVSGAADRVGSLEAAADRVTGARMDDYEKPAKHEDREGGPQAPEARPKERPQPVDEL